MDRTTQDLAWQCLPLEAKREVKQAFRLPTENDYEQGYDNALVSLFGIHNLTSDAEGEEMLCCERKWIQQMFADGVGTHYLLNIFGSKCLPDEEKPQPKFHKGDRVKVITDCWKDKVYTVTDVKEIYPQFSYRLSCSPTAWFTESTLEPYTEEPQPAEPKEKTCTDTCADDCSSQDFDRIAIDGFRRHNRLHIAAMAMAGILSKGELADPDEVTDMALIYADELIEKCEEGGTL